MSKLDEKQPVGAFRGKPIDAKMTKKELLEVITWAFSELTYLRKEVYENSDAINNAKIDRLYKS